MNNKIVREENILQDISVIYAIMHCLQIERLDIAISSTVLAVFQGADSPNLRVFQIFFNFPISLEPLIRYSILLAINIRIYIPDQALAAWFSFIERLST